MNLASIPSRQPERETWTMERLVHERALALGEAIDKSTRKSYGSAFNSYLNFVRMHDFDVEPTPDTLSFYTVYMSHHIEPRSVKSYLSGICQQLEPFFPEIRTVRRSLLVKRTLRGCLRMRSTPIKRKSPFSTENLLKMIAYYEKSKKHDDLLFICMLLTGFFALFRLGEMTFPDDPALREWRKVTRRNTVVITDDYYEFLLPAHKADQFFEGNKVIVRGEQYVKIDPLKHFRIYLESRDQLFPLSQPLWITSHGTVPTRSFFINRVRIFCDTKFGGQSMRAGGATYLAENGVSPSIIQAIGRWASGAFLIYIRKNPVLIQALLYARTTRQTRPK